MAIDGSLKGAPDHEGRPKVCGECATVPAKWECPERINRCEVFALQRTLEQAVLPLTLLTDNLGDRYTPWKNICQLLNRIEKLIVWETQFVVRGM